MKDRDELLKAQQDRINHMTGQISNDEIQKGGRKAVIGEIREYNGVKYKKVGEGKWSPVKGEGGDSKDAKSDGPNKPPTDMSKREHAANQIASASVDAEARKKRDDEATAERDKDRAGKSKEELEIEEDDFRSHGTRDFGDVSVMVDKPRNLIYGSVKKTESHTT